jgi:hypothetical protein
MSNSNKPHSNIVNSAARSRLSSGLNDSSNEEIEKLRRVAEQQLSNLNSPHVAQDTTRFSESKPTEPFRPSNNAELLGQESEAHNRPLIVGGAAIFGLAIGLSSAIHIFIYRSDMNSSVESNPEVAQNPPPRRPAQWTPDPPRPKAARQTAPQLPSRTENTAPESPPPSIQTLETRSNALWQACIDENGQTGAPPQPGETWWPVVGPGNSLSDARRHCRPDAFINRNGNAQISSFRDQETASAFAERLSQDSSHPWRFWVGDPSTR